jgi:hypothetical protein
MRTQLLIDMGIYRDIPGDHIYKKSAFHYKYSSFCEFCTTELWA